MQLVSNKVLSNQQIKKKEMETVNLIIDGKAVVAEKGQTILKAARKAGISIPTLCYYELNGQKLENKPGGCRVCVVEVEGRKNLAPACATEVMEGMVVHTHSGKVRKVRKTNVKLILSQHDFKCATCIRSGNCSLQKIANELNIGEMPYHMELEKTDIDTSTLSEFLIIFLAIIITLTILFIMNYLLKVVLKNRVCSFLLLGRN